MTHRIPLQDILTQFFGASRKIIYGPSCEMCQSRHNHLGIQARKILSAARANENDAGLRKQMLFDQ
jgi:hypothetical protein